MNRIIIFVLCLSAWLAAGCSGGLQLVSGPASPKTIVDGDISEWNNLTPVKNENISFGVRNDDKFLYLAISTSDRSKIMRILSGGLQVWLESPGTGQKLGIQFPDKPDPEAMRKTMDEKIARGEMNKMDRPDISALVTNMKILNDKEQVIEEFLASGQTYQGKIRVEKEKLSYEIRVPVGPTISIPEGLKIKPGEEISIEIASGEFGPGNGMPPPQMGGGAPPMGGGAPPMGGGGMPPMGGGGQGGMPHNGSGGRGNGPGMDMKPLSYELNVKLQ